MEIIDNNISELDKNSLAPLEGILTADLNRTAFFDIETTGLSRERSMLYLAGFVYFEDDSWRYRQFLAENEEDEFRTLLCIREFMKNFSLIITFNGERFDLPFISARYEKYDINASLPESFDIYRQIRPFKNLLGLDSMKQKAIESFLGIRREDKMSGGELISVYWDYVEKHGEHERSLLLLHNADDIAGMPDILQIFRYLSAFFEAPDIVSFSVNGTEDLLLEIKLSGAVPHDRILSSHGLHIAFRGDRAVISIPFTEGEFKHFFKDYKNYYYLPEEDACVHKSVGDFM